MATQGPQMAETDAAPWCYKWWVDQVWMGLYPGGASYRAPYGAECDIRENVDTNECPNIFVSTNYTNEYPNIFILICLTRTNVQISIRIENCTKI